MRFAFVYAEAENTPAPGFSTEPGSSGAAHTRHLPLPAVRIATAAERARTRGTTDFHRALACLDRMWHTISVSGSDSPHVSSRTIDWAGDEVDSDEMFRPQAFRAPTLGGES